MSYFLDILKTIVLGIIQGITEWLPISSTGHLLLFEELFQLKNVRSEFFSMFSVVIQFGSILAVVVLFWNKLWPFGKKKDALQKKSTWNMWGKVLVAAVPAALIGFFLDDVIEEYIYGGNIVKCSVIAGTLIVYGVAFILIERKMAKRKNRVETLEDLSYKDALFIGCFQVLALIPGTSRSGSTIVGARTIGISRTAAAEFSFFLALPIMVGASGLKLLKYFINVGWFTAMELILLLIGMVVSFAVSLGVIKFLMDFVRRHSFEPFGWYRIALGVVVLLYMLFVYIVPGDTPPVVPNASTPAVPGGSGVEMPDVWFDE